MHAVGAQDDGHYRVMALQRRLRKLQAGRMRKWRWSSCFSTRALDAQAIVPLLAAPGSVAKVLLTLLGQAPTGDSYELHERGIEIKPGPGGRWYSQRELAALSGVVVNTVRKALAWLEKRGLIERKIRKGDRDLNGVWKGGTWVRLLNFTKERIGGFLAARLRPSPARQAMLSRERVSKTATSNSPSDAGRPCADLVNGESEQKEGGTSEIFRPPPEYFAELDRQIAESVIQIA